MSKEQANMAAHYEHEIPEGHEARIEGNKVIIEPKESEDERIRKTLIHIVKGACDKYGIKYKGEEISEEKLLSYLEKQKDLTKEGIIKQLEEEFYACGTTPKWFHDTVQGAINHGRADALSKFNAVPSVVSDELRRQERETAISQLKHLNDVYIGDEKQKDSLYRDKIDQHNKEILDGTYKMREHLYECTKSLKHKPIQDDTKKDSKVVKFDHDKEQKHKIARWRSLGDCLDIPDGHYVVGWFHFGDFRLGIMCNGLFVDPNGNRAEQPKEIFYIPNADEEFIYAEQKPAEWSEEDEAAFGDLMWCIEQARKSAKDENDMGNIWFAENWVKNRLKTLRPQPHWKPSEEQMKALEDAKMRMSLDGYGLCPLLQTLINDLKKL